MSEHSLPILVVEDDPSLREAIGDTLELAGRSYVAVDGGEAALRRTRTIPAGHHGHRAAILPGCPKRRAIRFSTNPMNRRQ